MSYFIALYFICVTLKWPKPIQNIIYIFLLTSCSESPIHNNVQGVLTNPLHLTVPSLQHDLSQIRIMIINHLPASSIVTYTECFFNTK